jgi:hypothetical protein
LSPSIFVTSSATTLYNLDFVAAYVTLSITSRVAFNVEQLSL